MTHSFSKFYQKSRVERLQLLHEAGYLTDESHALFERQPGLTNDVADSLIENQLTQFSLPTGVALNFVIDGNELVIPMVVEEPSVIAACSNAAKIMKPLGFTTTIKQRLMIGQIILTDIDDFSSTLSNLASHKEDILTLAHHSHPSIVTRGGGVKDIDIRVISNEEHNEEFITLHLHVDVRDAMGANIINTILEGVTPYIEDITGASVLMSILSNYNTEALVTATCRVPMNTLDTSSLSGEDISKKIVAATRYANLDPYRAATHNKGIMNGIDSVVIATGNDPRAVSSGAHAYASRSGQYKSMTRWTIDGENLVGELTLPMAVGSVGGAISVLPMAQANLKIMGVTHSEQLARIIVSVGLAQNFAALKALVSDGIQKGHMKLHASSLAIQVGAVGEEIEAVANHLREAPLMNTQVASAFLTTVRSKDLS